MDPEIESILASSGRNGGQFWARTDGNIHAPAGFSTLDVLNTLGDLGVKYTDSDVIIEAIDFLFTYYQPDGCFRYNVKSSKLPCITASILTACGRLGYWNERLEACYRRFLETQEDDGGWRCNTVKLGKSPVTDASNPGTTLYVLDAFLYRENSADEMRQLERGVRFLLDHWDSRVPLGPCQFGIGSTFLKPEYPMLRYNILYYCYVLSKYRAAIPDKRFREAVEVLKTKVTDGNLMNENPHRAWSHYSFARKGAASEPAAKKYVEILESCR
ncbi:MAG: hypothetical protein JW760_14870 [Spirochaetales bacterium]|nr:hypothetical protein [Spirochaetales bacterium]